MISIEFTSIVFILSMLQDNPVPFTYIIDELGVKYGSAEEKSLIRALQSYKSSGAYSIKTLGNSPQKTKDWIKEVYGRIHGNTFIISPNYREVIALRKKLKQELDQEYKYLLNRLT